MLTLPRFKPPGVQSGVNANTRDGFEALRVIKITVFFTGFPN